METFIWILTIGLVLVGLAGTVLPLLPGTTFILAGMVLHRIALPDYLTWWSVGGIAFLFVLSVLVDLLGTLVGTRLGGGGKWGMAGAATGSLAGFFVSVPAVILGSIVGAALAEKLGAGKSNDAALRAGVGAGVGFVIGTLGKVLLACAMLAVFVLDCMV